MSRVSKTRADTLFVLIIFCVFAVSVLLVLMLGADINQSMTEISREQEDERMVLSYIRTKFRSNDENGNVFVGEFAGIPALIYKEDIGGRAFHTLIYHYDGWLRELFSEVDLDFLPSDGTAIIPVDNLLFEVLDIGLIRITAGTKSLLLHPRTTVGEVYS